MTPLELFFLLRRHKWVLVAAVLVGLAAGWISAPGESNAPPEYDATTTLIVNAQADTPPNLDQVALLATTGAVPDAAAKALGVSTSDIDDAVETTTDPKAGSLRITATSTDPSFAEGAANAVSDALLTSLTGTDRAAYDQRLAELNGKADELRARVAQGAGTGPAAEADFSAAQSNLQVTLQQISALTSAGPPAAPLDTVQKASAHEADKAGIAAPDSKPARAGVLAVFGLLIGIGTIFALDRLDTRIHTKGGAEAAFGFPVIAEIPPLPPGSHRELMSETHPASQFVEAYRGLRTHLALAGEEQGMRPPEAGNGAVVLITSPLAGEGKTTSVAHVAAMLGEVGRSVLVVSGDFRRPRLHELFHRERTPGLSEVLSDEGSHLDVGDLDLRTKVDNVQFLASGSPVSSPAVIVKRTPQVLEAAAPFWEFILVDSAPLLVANDTSDLARSANGVVVLARSGRTTIDAAERTAELLRRIEAPVLGVVLIAAAESPTAYRYYRTRYYAEPDKPDHWWQRRRGGSSAGTGGKRGKGAAAAGAPAGRNGNGAAGGASPSDWAPPQGEPVLPADQR